MADSARYLLNLCLRSERALGLEAIRLTTPRSDDAPAHPQEPADVAAVRRPETRAPRAASTPTAAVAAQPTTPQATLLPAPLLQPQFTTPPAPPEQKQKLLNEMDANEVRGCTRCRLCQTRTHTVFGEGSADARLMFIGEGPGENEDQQGRPFVGRAGQKLDEMIRAMGLQRQDVYIANIVKCRPPGNRTPAPDEVATCTPYLDRQIEVIRPRVIVTLGLPATQYMLQAKLSISRIRGQWQQWRGIKLMPTFHPAYILRNYTAEVRAAVWSDLQQVMAELGLSAGAQRKRT